MVNTIGKQERAPKFHAPKKHISFKREAQEYTSAEVYTPTSSCTPSDVSTSIPVVTYNVEDETEIVHAARGQLIEKRTNPQWREAVKSLISNCVPAVHQKSIEKTFLYGTSKPTKVVCSVLRRKYLSDKTGEAIKYILSHCLDDLDHPQVWGTLARKRYNNPVRGWYSRELERIREK